MGFKLPYQIFPGIFSSLDSYQKKLIHGYYSRHNTLPAWFSSLNLVSPLSIPNLSEFRYHDLETDILLTGIPDDMFLRPDQTILIGDYKTAKFSGNQDSLLPIYQAQLNGYALIVETLKMGTVSGLALIYFEPVTDIEGKDVDALLNAQGFAMKFAAKILPIELNLDMILPLLREARAIYDMKEAPERIPNCPDCKRLDEMFCLVEDGKL